jgi:phage terminase large subunit-like protein
MVRSCGAECARLAAEAFGRPQRPWQKHALKRGLELGADGRLRWRIVVLSVARQQGKSDLLRALAWWRMRTPRYREAQLVMATANRVLASREVWRPLRRVAEDQDWIVRLGRAEEEIESPRGDRYLIRAATDALGSSYSVDLGLVDEAWDVERDHVESGLLPAQSAREDAQCWLVSTAGDSTSDLLRSYREQAIAELDHPGSILLLEWSAPEHLDAADPATWRWASPHWDDGRERVIREHRARMTSDKFETQYLNRWVTTLNGMVDASVWASLADPETVEAAFTNENAAHIAVEVDTGGTNHAVACAVNAPDGRIAVRVVHLPSYAAVDSWLLARMRAKGIATLRLTPPYERRVDPRLTFTLCGRREAPAATRSLLEVLATNRLAHEDDPVLTLHALRARAIQGEGGAMLSTIKSAGSVHAARAMMFALDSCLAQPVRSARPRVRFRTG